MVARGITAKFKSSYLTMHCLWLSPRAKLSSTKFTDGYDIETFLTLGFGPDRSLLQPIPLELLVISSPDDYATIKPGKNGHKQLVKNGPHAPVVATKDSKGGFSITFVHLGRKYYSQTLWANTYVSQRKWVEHIQKQQEAMRVRSNVFETVVLSESFFVGVMRVNCAAPFSK